MRSNETPQAKLQKVIWYVKKGLYPVKTAVTFFQKGNLYEMGGRMFTEKAVKEWIRTHPTSDGSEHHIWHEVKTYEQAAH